MGDAEEVVDLFLRYPKVIIIVALILVWGVNLLPDPPVDPLAFPRWRLGV